MAVSCSSEIIQTRQQGTRITAFPSHLIEKNSEEIAGKQLLHDAADQGQLDAIFVLGMILMAEGIERKHEALIMVNNAYVNTRRSWNLRHTSDTDNYDDYEMSSNGSDNENNIDEEGEIYEDDDDGIPDNEGTCEYIVYRAMKREEDEEE
uniref:Uncharacterized protein n=1 Tax=Lactuca sativa TaxID=4236 RepID=A0A9R1W991_LACSA|nr:hypothetical protein LSAT_V11C300141070 [Lactuca sativa]